MSVIGKVADSSRTDAQTYAIPVKITQARSDSFPVRRVMRISTRRPLERARMLDCSRCMASNSECHLCADTEYQSRGWNANIFLIVRVEQVIYCGSHHEMVAQIPRY